MYVHPFVKDEKEILGSGNFGVVFMGKMWDQKVAVKTVKPYSDKIYLHSLLSEIKVLIHLGQHENIVSLLGAFTLNLKSGVIYLFLEYCEFGNLLNYLRKKKNNTNSDAGQTEAK